MIDKLSRRRLRIMAAMAAVLSAAPAWCEDKAALQPLVEQARHWESKFRPDLAAEIWKKVLLLDPNNGDALAGLAVNAARQGRTEEANAYAARLKAIGPGHPGLPQVQDALGAATVDKKELQEARELARQGKAAEAVGKYRKAFGAKGSPSSRLEYYETLAGLESGWEEARQGLSQLVRDYPKESRFALALARVLTYRESSRAEGVATLRKLAADPATKTAAEGALAQAREWNKPVPGAKPATSAKRVPEPKEYGFQALEEGELGKARDYFNQQLAKSAHDPEATAGLGVIALRQKRFGEAANLLGRATGGMSPAARRRWDEALKSAKFWALIEEARRSGGTDEHGRSASLLKAAQRLQLDDNGARIALADLLAEEQRWEDAEPLYRSVLAREPDNVDAVRGLINLLSRSGRADEAVRRVDRLPAEHREMQVNIGQMRADELRAQAGRALRSGDRKTAERLLSEAMTHAPNSPWPRLDMAFLLRDGGHYEEAEAVLDGLLVSAPGLPDVLYAKALLQADRQRWEDGLYLLERVPSNARSPEMAVLQRRLWVHAQVERARNLAKNGARAQAGRLLDMAGGVADSSELIGAIAQGFAEIGDAPRALGLMREALSRNPRPPSGLRVQYAGVLLSTGQFTELGAQLNELGGQRGRMSAAEREGLDRLEIAYAVNRADRAREQGQFADAYDYLSPRLKRDSRSVELRAALARLYDSADEPGQALSIYEQILGEGDKSVPVLLGASGAALKAGEYDRAEDWLDLARRKDERNPSVYAMLGRLARAQGKEDEALRNFEQALRLDRGGPSLASGGPAPDRAAERGSSNPFRNRAGKGGRSEPGYARPYEPGSMNDSAEDASQPSSLSGNSGPAPDPDYVIDVPRRKESFPALEDAGQGRWRERKVSLPRAVSGERLPALDDGERGPPLRRAEADPGEERTELLNSAPERLPVRLAKAVYYADYESARSPRLSSRESEAIDHELSTLRANSADGGPSEAADARPGALDALRPEERRSLGREIKTLRESNSPYTGGGLFYRNRSGEKGLGRMTDIELPLEARINSPFDSGKFKIHAVPVVLEAGKPAGDSISRFGTAALDSAEAARQVDSQRAEGVALAAEYERGNLSATVGTSPLGFEKQDVTGRLAWRVPVADRTHVALQGTRELVTDSLLSYAGTTDPLSGRFWGAVKSTGGRVGISNDEPTYGLYAHAGYHDLSGDNVPSNNLKEGSAGLYFQAYKDPNQKITAGVNVTGLFYDRNLSGFTFGQGGYFSPQFYVRAGVPLEWSGNHQNFRFLLRGDVGLQTFRQNAAPYYPEDPDLQARLESLGPIGPDGQPRKTRYEEQQTTGLGYGLYGFAEYLLNPNLVLGGLLSLNNAKNFDERAAMLYLRYWFNRRDQLGDDNFEPVKPLFLYKHL